LDGVAVGGQSDEERGVFAAGGQRKGDGVCGDDERGEVGVGFPVVVGGDGCAGGIYDGDDGVGEQGGDVESGEAGADGADEEAFGVGAAPGDDAGDGEGGFGADEGAGREVGEARGVVVVLVNFDEGDAGGVVFAGDDGGVRPGREGEDAAGVGGAGGEGKGTEADRRAGDAGDVVGGAPIVVGVKDGSGGVVDREDGIGEGAAGGGNALKDGAHGF